MNAFGKGKISFKNFFRLGVFLLPSVPFLSVIFFLISITYSIYKKGIEILKDKYNILFFISIFAMIFVASIHFFFGDYLLSNFINLEELSSIKKISKIQSFSPLSFIGLSNWIPLFFCFFGFQNYLNSFNERKLIMKFFLAGTFPVLITGFGQYFFNWHGPLELFDGLIIWFQKPSDKLIGLFSNPNYTGSWLAIVWPFSLAIFLDNRKDKIEKNISLIFLISIAIAILLTSSRNALGGLILSIPLLLSPSSFIFTFPLLTTLSILIFLNFLNFIPENINNFMNSIITPDFNILENFASKGYIDDFHKRSFIITFALKMIAKNPFIGFGAASFPIYYSIEYDLYKAHAHNLLIDLTFNYGIVITLLIFTNILIIFYKTFRKIFLSKSSNLSKDYFERAWWTSFFILLISQMFDVQYYDFRISITFWLLLSGLKCMINENKENKIYTN